MSLIDDLKQQAQQEAGWILAHDLYIADANFTILGVKLNPQGKFGPKWDLEIKVEAIFQDVELPLPESGKCSLSMGSNPTRDAFFRLLQPYLPVYNMSVDETPTEKGNPYNDLVEIKSGDDRYIEPPKRVGRTPAHARIETKSVPQPPIRKRPVTTTSVTKYNTTSPAPRNARSGRPIVEEDPFLPEQDYEVIDEEDGTAD